MNAPSPAIRLLSTDFDGTLVDHFATPPVVPGFFVLLERLRREGVRWALNTGRDLRYALDGLREYHFPVEPDYILTNEREIFHRDPQGEWRDYGDWNRRCLQAHERLFQTEAPFLRDFLHFLKEETSVETIYERDRVVGLRAKTEAEMERVIARLCRTRRPGSLFSYQRNTEFLRFCHADYSKGAALGELCRLTHIPAGAAFAVGDHHNDLAMLDGRYARYAAAPGNAIELVKETVRKAGGYVAQAHCSAGVVEALEYFLRGEGAGEGIEH